VQKFDKCKMKGLKKAKSIVATIPDIYELTLLLEYYTATY